MEGTNNQSVDNAQAAQIASSYTYCEPRLMMTVMHYYAYTCGITKAGVLNHMDHDVEKNQESTLICLVLIFWSSLIYPTAPSAL